MIKRAFFLFFVSTLNVVNSIEAQIVLRDNVITFEQPSGDPIDLNGEGNVTFGGSCADSGGTILNLILEVYSAETLLQTISGFQCISNSWVLTLARQNFPETLTGSLKVSYANNEPDSDPIDNYAIRPYVRGASDTMPPTLQISGPQRNLINSQSFASFNVDYQDADEILLSNAHIELQTTGNAQCQLQVLNSTPQRRLVEFRSCSGDGSIRFRILAGSARDLAGNLAAASGLSNSFTVDNTPPRITLGAPLTNLVSSRSPALSMSILSSEAVAGDLNSKVKLDFGVAQSTQCQITTSVSNKGFSSATSSTRSPISLGQIELRTCQGNGPFSIAISKSNFKDLAGNSSLRSNEQSLVVDNLPPVITATSPIEILVGSHYGLTEDLAGVSATDARQGNLTDQIVRSGVVFPLNTTAPAVFTVQYQATDSLGNRSDPFVREIVVVSPPPTGECTGPAEQQLRLPSDFLRLNADPTGSFEVCNDIDFEGFALPAPIGFEFPFQGVLEGNNYELRNLSLLTPGESHVGLFGQLGAPANIRNLRIRNFSMAGNYYVGALAGSARSFIPGQTVQLTNIHIEDSSVTGERYVGGLVGDAEKIRIQNSSAQSTVEAQYRFGGLVGRSRDSLIEDSFASGEVSVLSTDPSCGSSVSGGLVGFAENQTQIRRSYALTTVTGLCATGGLVGSVSNSRIYDSFSIGEIIGYGTGLGGLVGTWNDGGRLSGSYTSSTVIPMRPIIPTAQGPCVGGLIGSLSFVDGTIFVAGEVLPSFWNSSVNPTYVPNIPIARNHYRDEFRAIGSLLRTTSLYPHAHALTGTTETLREAATFANQGWDFENLWQTAGDQNEGFPIFRN